MSSATNFITFILSASVSIAGTLFLYLTINPGLWTKLNVLAPIAGMSLLGLMNAYNNMTATRQLKFLTSSSRRKPSNSNKNSEDEELKAESLAVSYSLFFNNLVFLILFTLLTSGLTSVVPVQKYAISTFIPVFVLGFLTKPNNNHKKSKGKSTADVLEELKDE